jgi:hypothetical protein
MLMYQNEPVYRLVAAQREVARRIRIRDRFLPGR